ncbi:peptidase S1 and S6, chymotrypsin/Hap [Catenovulum agarivorans DS-2]|uniref:Peptidase S1 and S6, chymotrypsin/Hap n=1 Tax=Catenovulum agarivorans DS-2 TaxID=1328313 RepID=W7R0J4_9ALTE|nr:serine protease [Catenovulum agarivorans]EWH11125.1 peptidase S1 and S6, chymotrypsin/Hap [Catenovulum agarivorans DS-2]
MVKQCTCYALFILGFLSFNALSQPLVQTIKSIKPSIVAIGVYSPTSSPRAQVRGTGFAIGDGRLVATNHHVIPEIISGDKSSIVVFIGTGKTPKLDFAKLVKTDKEHDLAILQLTTHKLPPLNFVEGDNLVEEGHEIAFTGYPIGSVLGLYPVTHRGIISAVTPVAVPAATSTQLNIARLKRLKAPWMTYQLDATAYPGNSGSPLYLQSTGEVIGVINKVLVKQSKENVLSAPSAITYAIPVKYLRALLE